MVADLERLGVDCVPQPDFDVEAAIGRFGERAIEVVIAVAAGALRVVHRDVGLAEQARDVVARLGDDDADAGGLHHLAAFDDQRVVQ